MELAIAVNESNSEKDDEELGTVNSDSSDSKECPTLIFYASFLKIAMPTGAPLVFITLSATQTPTWLTTSIHLEVL